MRRSHNLIPKLHVKKGDQVKVLSGDDKGKTGRILAVNPRKMLAIVEGINIVTKHQKPNQKNPQGARVEQEAPLHVAKLQLIEPSTGKPTRIGRQKTEDGWVRVSKKTGNVIA